MTQSARYKITAIIMDCLRNSAIQLIDKTLDFNALMYEILDSPINKEWSQTSPDKLDTEKSLYDCLKLQATLSKTDISCVALQMLMKRLCKISQTYKVMLNDEVNDFLNVVAASGQAGVQLPISLSTLSQYSTSFLHCIPFDLLLLLHKENMMILKDFLIVNVNHKHILKEFIWPLQQLARETEPGYAKTFAGILSLLIRYGYDDSDSKSKGLRKMCGYILFTAIKYNLLHLIELPPSRKSSGFINQVLALIRVDFTGDSDLLQRAFTRIISLWITLTPNLNASDAISTQHKWTASKQNETIITFYKEMIMCVGYENVIRTIENTLERREFNWHYLLTFVSAVLVNFPDSTVMFTDLIDRKLKEGLEASSAECLTVAFLFTRHLGLEGSHAFTSYSDWFQGKFGSQSTLLSSTRYFRFFIKFLSDLVPYEPSRFLKVHVIKPPHCSSSCADLLQDYMSLARCRLSELGSSCVDEVQDSSEVEKDVKNVVEEYEKSNKVPKFLTEASIFRKTYFCGKFVPALLKPRALPDIPDATMKLVEELVKANKITRNLYTNYKELCRHESEKLLNEVIEMDAESAFDDLESEEPDKQFEISLRQISEAVSSLTYKDFQECSCELMTKLSRALHVMTDGKAKSNDLAAEYDLVNQNEDAILDKAANHFLEWLGGIYHKLLLICFPESSLHHGLTGVLKTVHDHRTFTKCILHRIWSSCCCDDISQCPDHLMQGISVYLTMAGTDINVLIPARKDYQYFNTSLAVTRITVNFTVQYFCNLLQSVLCCIRYYIGVETMIASAKLFCYLTNAFKSFSKSPDEMFINHLLYIKERLAMLSSGDRNFEQAKRPKRAQELDLLECKALLSEITKGANYQTLSISEFLQREILIENDFLNSEERRQLHSNIFFKEVSVHQLDFGINTILHYWMTYNGSCKDEDKPVIKKFLSSLPLLISSCDNVIHASFFLLAVLEKRTKIYDADGSAISADILWQKEIEIFSHFILKLPPCLLFQKRVKQCSSDISGLWSLAEGKTSLDSAYDYISKIINIYLCHLNTKIGHMLPPQLAVHLITGSTQCIKNSSELLHFLVCVCPVLFVSLLVQWNYNHELRFVLASGNNALFTLVKEILLALNCDEDSLNKSCDVLLKSEFWGHSGDIVQFSHDQYTSESTLCVCFAFIELRIKGNSYYSDASCTRNFVRNHSKILGILTSCLIIKLHDEVSQQNEQSFQPYKTFLEVCLDEMNPEEICHTVMKDSNRITDYFISRKKYPLAILSALSRITLPRNLTAFANFKSSLRNLCSISQRLFGKEETLQIGEIWPGLQHVLY